MKPGKATSSQLRQHNRQLILRYVFKGAATSRAGLAQATGLTKPAVSDLVESLIADGLLIEEGYGASTDSGGKRPRLLRFIRDSRQVIGISINATAIIGVLTNLDGEVIAEHAVGLNDDDPEIVFKLAVEVINGLMAQLHAPLLCIGVGISAIVDSGGRILYAQNAPWKDFALVDRLRARFRVPIHIANSSELAALAQYTFKSVGEVSGVLATIVIDASVGVGVVFDGAAHHIGGEIGYLVDANQTTLTDQLGWTPVLRRARAAGLFHPERMELTYLHIRFAAAHGNAAAQTLCWELAAPMARLFAWVMALYQPDTITLAGMMSDLGEPFLAQAVEQTRARVLPELVDRTKFVLDSTLNLAALGASARSIQMELGLI